MQFLLLMSLGTTVSQTCHQLRHQVTRFVLLIGLCLPSQNQAGASVDRTWVCQFLSMTSWTWRIPSKGMYRILDLITEQGSGGLGAFA
jgi:hypothetical protein